jgi:hypothetical protein
VGRRSRRAEQMENAERAGGASAHPDDAPANGVAQGDDTKREGRSATNPSGPPRNGSESPTAQSGSGMARGYARGRERDERIRAELEPLQAGERPAAVTVAAAVAAALGIANLVLYAAGTDVQGKAPNAAGVIAFAAIMFAAAYGMYRARYWAVLGFQALLAVTVVIAALSLLVASNVAAVLLCLAIVGLGGVLFWKLIRAMARIQMPARDAHR